MTQPTERKDSICPACGHGLNSHFRDVTGIARCTVVHSGVTDRGIIGIPGQKAVHALTL